MTMFPIKQNKENNSKIAHILLGLTDSRWIKILNGSSVKILIHFCRLEEGGQVLKGDYDFIGNSTGATRTPVSNALTELTAFGFISEKKKLGTTKIYTLNSNIIYLSEAWVKFLSVKSYKSFCIKVLMGQSIKNDVINDMQESLNTNNEDYLENTLGKLLYLYFNKKDLSIEDLIDEDLSAIDKLQNNNSWDLNDNASSWKQLLDPIDRENSYLIEILELFADVVDNPIRDDIDAIKIALEYCYPYQIRNAIKVVKSHPQQGVKFKRFKYILRRLQQGTYGGTRKNNNLKNNYNDSKVKPRVKTPNLQKDTGYKTVKKSRAEMIEYLDNASLKDNNEKPFDFNAFAEM